MNKIPTAEEFLEQNNCSPNKIYEPELWNNVDKQELIEFAKLHVQAALEAASEKVVLTEKNSAGSRTGVRISTDGWAYSEIYPNKDSILNAYPLDNIK